jgi:UDP-N-acetylmuramate: L-alanyl-gamma-D-glutamyl-meso-diaminopimelate ligase
MNDLKMSDLKNGAVIHLMGICGTAMASLAGLLKDRGFRVTGSDANPYPPMSTQLADLGIEIMKGYSAKNLSHHPDFVIVGNVISKENPEAVELQRLKIPFSSLPCVLGDVVIAKNESVVISGTHGKTTTTSLMSWVAECNGIRSGFLIGGIPKNFLQSFRNPKDEYFIIEGDEYDTAYFDKVPKFVHYKPKHVILTSIEFDHADIYKDLDHVKSAFKQLLDLMPADGTLVTHAEDKNILDVINQCEHNLKVQNRVTYGFHKADYLCKKVREESGWTYFQVFQGTHFLGEYQLAMPGDYNILNATAVIAMADQLKWNSEKTREALQSFLGVKRRQEIIGEPRGITIIEDFAHHPTAVRETIKGIQSRFPGRKVFSVFEPRSATSRRKIFQKDYVTAFKTSEEVLIARAFDQSKISSEDRFSTIDLVSDLKTSQVKAAEFENADAIVKYLKAEAKPQDVILIMSNGGFDGIYQKLLTILSQTISCS